MSNRELEAKVEQLQRELDHLRGCYNELLRFIVCVEHGFSVEDIDYAYEYLEDRGVKKS